jgi:hypothetical protein
VETEFLMKSLLLYLVSLVNIDNIPFLVWFSMVAPGNNSLTFNIFSSSDIKNLSVTPVDELVISILEELPPS